MGHPLLAPLGPQPELPPDISPEDRAAFLQQYKWQQYSHVAMESCAAKTVLSGGIGFGLGAFISLMSAAMQYETPSLYPSSSTGLLIAQKASDAIKETGRNMWSSGKMFGTIGALYAASECVIEGYRAKDDITNHVAAGFVSGAILARNSGPKGMLGGAVGFAAFSFAIEKFMHWDWSSED